MSNKVKEAVVAFGDIESTYDAVITGSNGDLKQGRRRSEHTN